MRVSFSQENKAESAFDFPQLKLLKNETARVVALEEPEMEFVHVLRAPQVVNGTVVTEPLQQKDGTSIQVPKYDFVGRHICLGDVNTIMDRGSDPANCPTCARAQESDALKPPERRFGMNIVRYQLAPNRSDFAVANPFAVAIQAWLFADKVFNKLADLQSTWGDLKAHDLLLGPCKVQQYQQFDIAVAPAAEWRGSRERAEQVVQSFKQNQCKDMQPLIGRKLDRAMIEQDIAKVLHRYQQAFGGGSAAPDGGAVTGAEGLGNINIDDLLGGGNGTGTTVVPEGTVGTPVPTVSMDDPLAGLLDVENKADEPRREALVEAAQAAAPPAVPQVQEEAPVPAVTPEPAMAAAPAAAPQVEDKISFDDLLADL